MKRILLVLLALVALTCLCGCKREPVFGSVVEKTFIPAHTEVGVMLIPDGNGGLTYMPYPDHVPDCYYLDVKRDDGRVFRVGVTRDYYDKAKVGDHYDERPKEQ